MSKQKTGYIRLEDDVLARVKKEANLVGRKFQDEAGRRLRHSYNKVAPAEMLTEMATKKLAKP